jgi:hypothetical protein
MKRASELTVLGPETRATTASIPPADAHEW